MSAHGVIDGFDNRAKPGVSTRPKTASMLSRLLLGRSAGRAMTSSGAGTIGAPISGTNVTDGVCRNSAGIPISFKSGFAPLQFPQASASPRPRRKLGYEWAGSYIDQPSPAAHYGPSPVIDGGPIAALRSGRRRSTSRLRHCSRRGWITCQEGQARTSTLSSCWVGWVKNYPSPGHIAHSLLGHRGRLALVGAHSDDIRSGSILTAPVRLSPADLGITLLP